MSHWRKVCTPSAKLEAFWVVEGKVGIKTEEGVWARSVRRGDDARGSSGENDGKREAGKRVRRRIGRWVMMQSASTKR